MLPKLPVEEEQAASANAQAAPALRRAPSENAVKWPRSPIPSPTRADRPPKTTESDRTGRIRRSRPLPYVGENNAVSGATAAGYPRRGKRPVPARGDRSPSKCFFVTP